MKTENAILIQAGYDLVFDLSNDIENWPQLFHDYTKTEILDRQGNIITYRLTNSKGESWVSWSLPDKANKRCHARRIDPMFPFKTMNVDWEYEERENGVLMVWKQYFEMDEKAPVKEETAKELIDRHLQENMQKMKQVIEEKHRGLACGV